MAPSCSLSLAPQMTLVFTAFSRVFLWWKRCLCSRGFTKTSKFGDEINSNEYTQCHRKGRARRWHRLFLE